MSRTHNTLDTGKLYVDTRLSGHERWYLGKPPADYHMRVPDILKKCVCFLCVKTGSAGNERLLYGGTGFFVSIRSEMHGPNVYYGYLVTARHNITKAERYGALHIRVNVEGGSSRHIEITEEWYTPENDAVDIAILPFRSPQSDDIDATAIRAEIFATDSVIKRYRIGIGEDLFVTGLFTSCYGTDKNLPILRSGILAAMPEEPLRDEATGLPYYAFLAEMRSLGGLSGSPVFAYVERKNHYLSVVDVLAPSRIEVSDGISRYRDFLLLGVIRGHWDHRTETTALDYADDTLAAVNMGIATVTPIEAAFSLLMRDDLVALRHRMDLETARERHTTIDFA